MGNSLDDIKLVTPKEETYDLLKPDEEEVIPKTEEEEEVKEEEKEPDEEEKEEEIELAEDEDEEKIPDEEELELVTPVRRKEILAKYPTLFKDFPYLEKAYFRDQQFTEILPTLEDAKAAVEAKQVLDKYAEQLSNGDPRDLLKTVKQNDPNGFARLVDNYLGALQEADPLAFVHVGTNIIKGTVANMVQEAQRTNNEALLAAAQIVHQFVTGTVNFQPVSNYSKQQPNQRDDNLDRERQEFAMQRFQYAQNDLATKLQNVLRSTVDQNIDPKGQMTAYIKDKAVSDALNYVEQSLSNDRQFRGLIDNLWKRAAANNFSSQSMDQIRKAYLSAARARLKPAINSSRNTALKGLVRRTSNEEDEAPKKGAISPGKAASTTKSSKSSSSTGKDDRGKPIKTLDFFMQD